MDEREKVLEKLEWYGVLASDERSLEELKLVLEIVSEDEKGECNERF